MDTKNIEKKDGKISFQVVVDAAAFEAAINKVYLRDRKNIMVPGFRKGKAPRMVVEGMYGKDVFHEEAVDFLALEAYQAGTEHLEDRTVGDPAITDFKVDEDKTLTISFEAALYPEASLGEYKGLKAYKAPAAVEPEEVQKELEAVQKRNSRIVTVDRGARLGDTVSIDFDGFRNGVRFSGGKGQNYSLTLGSGTFVPGFEDQLVGVKAGEETEVSVTFPEDYAPELAGADAVFKVKVNEVQETQMPELDDEFAKDVSEFDTLEEYRESLKKELEEKKEQSAENNYRNLLLRKAAENLTVDIPDAMINSRVNASIEELARSCAAQGMTLERYFQLMGLDERMYRGYIRPSVENEIRTELLLEKVAEAENIEVTAEEIEAEYKTSAERYEMEPEELKERVPADMIERDLKLKKAGELIAENGVPTDEPEDKPQAEANPAEETEPEE